MNRIKLVVMEHLNALQELLGSSGGRWIAGCLLLNVCVLGLGMDGCVTTPPDPPTIPEPDEAFQSPNMNFSEIATVGIFPFFPTGNENEQLGDTLSTTFVGEVQTRQGNAWKIHSHRDMFQFINEANLGKGYKQLQADHNSSGTGQLVLTPATKEFLRALQAKCGADAFLIGSYTMGSQPHKQMNYVTGQYEIVQIPAYSVRVALYSVKGDQYWWSAKITRAGRMEWAVKVAAESLAANIGKGTLRNL